MAQTLIESPLPRNQKRGYSKHSGRRRSWPRHHHTVDHQDVHVRSQEAIKRSAPMIRWWVFTTNEKTEEKWW